MRFVAWTWLGLLLGVSFLATPAKFRARSLTMPVALDVGRATFHLFSRLEWVLTAVLAALAVAAAVQGDLEVLDAVLVAAVAVIVVAQAAWLLPRLDVRVDAIIAGQELPPSPLHRVYAGAEAVKAGALLVIGAWTGGHV